MVFMCQATACVERTERRFPMPLFVVLAFLRLAANSWLATCRMPREPVGRQSPHIGKRLCLGVPASSRLALTLMLLCFALFPPCRFTITVYMSEVDGGDSAFRLVWFPCSRAARSGQQGPSSVICSPERHRKGCRCRPGRWCYRNHWSAWWRGLSRRPLPRARRISAPASSRWRGLFSCPISGGVCARERRARPAEATARSTREDRGRTSTRGATRPPRVLGGGRHQGAAAHAVFSPQDGNESTSRDWSTCGRLLEDCALCVPFLVVVG